MKIADLVRKVKVGGSSYYLKSGDTPARVIKHSNISEAGIIDFASVESSMIRTSERSIDNVLEPGDILIAGRSSTPKIALIPDEGKGYYFSSEFFALSLKPDIIKPELLEAYLSSPSVLNYLTKRSGTRILRTISKEDILALEVVIPDKEKQEKMAELTALMKEKYTIMEEEKRCMNALKTKLISSLIGGEEC